MVSQIKIEDLIVDGRFHPPIEKKFITLQPPTLADNISDLSRVIRALKQIHGIHNVNVDFYVIRKLSYVLRENDWKVTVTMGMPTKERRENSVGQY